MEISPYAPPVPITPLPQGPEVTTYRVEGKDTREITYVYDSRGELKATRTVTVDVRA